MMTMVRLFLVLTPWLCCQLLAAENPKFFDPQVRPVAPLALGFDVPLKAGGLTSAEALEDFHVFREILESAYAGYDYHQRVNHLDFRSAFAETEVALASAKFLTADGLAQLLVNQFKDLQDGHLSLAGAQYHPFISFSKFYHSGIVLERVGSQYRVADSDTDEAPPGAVYTGSAENLFPYFDPQRKLFLLGTLSQRSIHSLDTSFNREKVTVALLKSRIHQNSSEPVTIRTIGGATYIAVRTLWGLQSGFPGHDIDKELRGFMEMGKHLDQAKTLILDLRDNGGGNDGYLFQFLADLFHVERESIGMQTFSDANYDLVSPITVQGWKHLLDRLGKADFGRNWIEEKLADDERLLGKRPVRVWKVKPFPPETSQPVKPTFAGRIILVVNSGTGSSAEELVPILRHGRFSNFVIIGENTIGCQSFGNVLSYSLPHSGLHFQVPCTLWSGPLTDPNFKGEGRGYTPDYWVGDTQGLIDTASKIAGQDTAAFFQ